MEYAYSTDKLICTMNYNKENMEPIQAKIRFYDHITFPLVTLFLSEHNEWYTIYSWNMTIEAN